MLQYWKVMRLSAHVWIAELSGIMESLNAPDLPPPSKYQVIKWLAVQHNYGSLKLFSVSYQAYDYALSCIRA